MSDFQVDILSTDSTLSVDVYATPEISVNESTTSTPISLEFMSPLPVTVEMMTSGIKGDPGGLTCSKTAGETIGGHRVVIQSSDGKVYYASSYISEHSAKVCGITTHAATKDAQVLIQAADTLTETSWNWIPDLPIFLGDAGYLTQDENATGSFLLVMGVALSATSILIDKQVALFK